MAERTKSYLQVIKQTFAEFSEDDCASMAAGLAFYTIFSLPPLLVIVVSIVGLFWSPQDLQGTIENQVQSMVGEGGKEQFHAMMAQAGEHKRGIVAMVVGIGVLLAGATGLVAQLQHALNKAWEVEPDSSQGGIKNFIFKRILSLGMILAIAFLLLVSLVLTAILSSASGVIGGMLPDGVSSIWLLLINLVVSFLVIWLLFTSMFKFLPDAEIAWRDVWVGGAITTALFMVGKVIIGVYLGSQAAGAGPVILLLLWIYYSAMILLVGAEFTQVWAQSYGKEIRPKEGAVRVEREKVYERGDRRQTQPSAGLATPSTGASAGAKAPEGRTIRPSELQGAPISSPPAAETRPASRLPAFALIAIIMLIMISRRATK